MHSVAVIPVIYSKRDGSLHGRAVLANFILVYVYGARLAAATHGSERRVHFDGGGELPGVAMH